LFLKNQRLQKIQMYQRLLKNQMYLKNLKLQKIQMFQMILKLLKNQRFH
jgi:hypothetical protein